eukprot:1133644-Pelagomonas_calceolata.AAC.4
MQLAGKAEASRVQQLEEQVDEQLNVMCAMRSKQRFAVSSWEKPCAGNMWKSAEEILGAMMRDNSPLTGGERKARCLAMRGSGRGCIDRIESSVTFCKRGRGTGKRD